MIMAVQESRCKQTGLSGSSESPRGGPPTASGPIGEVDAGEDQQCADRVIPVYRLAEQHSGKERDVDRRHVSDQPGAHRTDLTQQPGVGLVRAKPGQERHDEYRDDRSPRVTIARTPDSPSAAPSTCAGVRRSRNMVAESSMIITGTPA